MSAIAYVNGAYMPLAAAGVSILDRGLQFADSIYEVWAVRGGRLCDRHEHMARLQRSLGELRIAFNVSEASLWIVIGEVMRRNRVRDGIVYLQATRGAAPRDHGFPAAGVTPSLIVTAKTLDRAATATRAAQGVAVITVPETRWARCDIKSTNLLANVLARQAAREAGAFEAWFVDEDGFVTEGTSSTAWIVDSEGRLRTRALSNRLLHGVTRAVLMRVAQARQIAVTEAAFTPREVQNAREAFISAASNPAVGIVSIDGKPIGDGRPGPVTQALRAAYLGAESGT